MALDSSLKYSWQSKMIFGLGLSILVCGLVVMVGWHVHSLKIIQIMPEFVPMKYNTAIGFMLCGLALVAISVNYKWPVVITGILLILLGSSALLENVLDIEIGIDQFFVVDYVILLTSHPGRMSMQSAFCFVCSGIIFLVYKISQLEKYRLIFIAGLNGLIFTLSFLSVLGYLLNIKFSILLGNSTGMAVHAAFTFFLISIAIMLCTFSRQKKTYQFLAFTIYAGLIITCQTYYILKDRQVKLMETKFHKESNDIIVALKDKISLTLQEVDALHAFFASSQSVDRNEFHIFCHALLKNRPYIQLFEWVPRVNAEDRLVYEENIKKEGIANYRIRQHRGKELVLAESRKTYFPVNYVEPYDGNEGIIGFDHGSNPIRWEAMTQAFLSKRIITTEQVVLADAHSTGLLIMKAFEGRGAQMPGLVIGVMNIKKSFYAIQDILSSRDINVFMFDLSVNKNNKFLIGYSAEGKLMESLKSTPEEIMLINSIYFSEIIEVGNRKHMILCVPSYNDIPLQHMPMFVAGVIAVLMMVINFYLWSYIRRTKIVELLVKQRTKELEEQTKLLEKVNLELDSFTYTASHDLRAPLRAISSFASFLEEDLKNILNDKTKDYLNEICKGANRMSSLIDDLLTLSRIARIKNPLENVNIEQVVQNVLERLRFDSESKNIDFKIQSLPKNVWCDRIKITELFVNLIGNAIKFSTKNNIVTPCIEVGYNEKEMFHEFYVRDNGIGIDPKYHAVIFDLFRRLHAQEEYEGTGAGLNIVKRIIDEHHGYIHVVSELGQGAVFCFGLPKKT